MSLAAVVVSTESTKVRFLAKVHLFLAIDRVSKFVFVELHPRATSMIGADLPRHALAAFPYKLHTILTDNGVAFTDCASTKYDWKVHPFNRICLAHGIKHKLTRPYILGSTAKPSA